jgi:Na+/H+ antiporter NhaC
MMTPDQATELQQHVERQAFDMLDIIERLSKLERHQAQEDLRKRLYRGFTIGGIMILMAMQWWGFTEILHHMGH